MTTLLPSQEDIECVKNSQCRSGRSYCFEFECLCANTYNVKGYRCEDDILDRHVLLTLIAVSLIIAFIGFVLVWYFMYQLWKRTQGKRRLTYDDRLRRFIVVLGFVYSVSFICSTAISFFSSMFPSQDPDAFFLAILTWTFGLCVIGVFSIAVLYLRHINHQLQTGEPLPAENFNFVPKAWLTYTVFTLVFISWLRLASDSEAQFFLVHFNVNLYTICVSVGTCAYLMRKEMRLLSLAKKRTRNYAFKRAVGAIQRVLLWMGLFLVPFALLIVLSRFHNVIALMNVFYIYTIAPFVAIQFGFLFMVELNTLKNYDIDGTITVKKKVGQGHFGSVYHGEYNHKTEVAMKSIQSANDNGEIEALPIEVAKEASIMMQLEHAHIVGFFGTMGVMLPQSTVKTTCLVMEWMNGGDLLSYLLRQRELPTLEFQVGMLRQVAEGMKYLHQMGFLHRDLACRNVMLQKASSGSEENAFASTNGWKAKVGDFGLSKLSQPNRSKENKPNTSSSSSSNKSSSKQNNNSADGNEDMLPVNWSAPEALKMAGGEFSTKSDVYSFGVLTFEVCTGGAMPYAGLTAYQVWKKVLGGHLLAVPSQARGVVREVMKACVQWFPDARPSFEDIVEKLQEGETEEKLWVGKDDSLSNKSGGMDLASDGRDSSTMAEDSSLPMNDLYLATPSDVPSSSKSEEPEEQARPFSNVGPGGVVYANEPDETSLTQRLNDSEAEVELRNETDVVYANDPTLTDDGLNTKDEIPFSDERNNTMTSVGSDKQEDDIRYANVPT